MEDIKSVLNQFHARKKDASSEVQSAKFGPSSQPLTSEIPDVFFDEILQQYKLTRAEISLLMYLYRQVWCRPNLYRSHGIGPLNSYSDLCSALTFNTDELVHHLRALEKYGFIETVRAGQYFVRKFFTEALDARFGQNYDEFF